MNIPNSIKQALKQTLQSRGIAVRRKPSYLLQHPKCELPFSFEFVVAHHALRTFPGEFSFIQVGAFDGVTNDPIYHFVRQYRWRGVLIEPQAKPFAQLQQNYADQPQLTLHHAAIADTDGVKPFYRVRDDVPGMPDFTRQLASFNKETILWHAHAFPDLEKMILMEEIPTVSFGTVLQDAGVSNLDLLQIDAEGFDFEVIKFFPLDRIKPAVIHYEHRHLASSMEESWAYLNDKGYKLFVDEEDTTAYRADLCPGVD
jgi:FkbM family methyltransferase